MSSAVPRLLAVAHGTASEAGSATTAALVEAIRAVRPTVPVDLCFLDVVGPRLPDALDDRPTVVVPLLLSTGYHVQSDIPSAVAPYPDTKVGRHLGPHPLLVDALADRLGPIASGESVALVGAGSSRPEAADELAETGLLLAARLGTSVRVLTLADDVRAALSTLPPPVRVTTYLLAEGQFVTTLQQAAAGLGSVAAPIGVHPALVRLVWQRYDAALAEPLGR
jgi:sirohydrochlorin ferrochelatase